MLAEAKLGAISAIYKRRAIRSYAAEKIDKAAIDELVDAAVHAPTAIHREPWVGVLNTPEVKRELGIPEGGAAVAPIIVGVPKGPIPAGTRKPPVVLSWIS